MDNRLFNPTMVPMEGRSKNLVVVQFLEWLDVSSGLEYLPVIQNVEEVVSNNREEASRQGERELPSSMSFINAASRKCGPD